MYQGTGKKQKHPSTFFSDCTRAADFMPRNYAAKFMLGKYLCDKQV